MRPRRAAVRARCVPSHRSGTAPAMGTTTRVQDGYVSAGTSGHVRPLRELKNCSVCSENMPARAREWTRVPHSSFPRNEGVQRFPSASLLKVAELSDGRDVCCFRRRGESIASRCLCSIVEPDNRAPVVRH